MWETHRLAFFDFFLSSKITNDKINETIEPTVTLNENLSAPIEEGQVVGTATYTVDNQTYTVNLKAGNTVKKSYTLYFIIVVAIIALILILFDKPNNSRNKKRSRTNTRRKPYVNYNIKQGK